jgi:nucleotidyltransferase substrate binding protein (TIGR01987 family)
MMFSDDVMAGPLAANAARLRRVRCALAVRTPVNHCPPRPPGFEQAIKVTLRRASAELTIMAQTPDVRWRQRFQSFQKALSQLRAAHALAQQRSLSELEQQGLIQAFEFTHELAWNVVKDFLESRGATKLYGSKDATREAFAKGLIANGDGWMDMIAARNRSTHTYNEKTAHEVATAILTTFVPEFEKFRARFIELEAKEP